MLKSYIIAIKTSKIAKVQASIALHFGLNILIFFPLYLFRRIDQIDRSKNSNYNFTYTPNGYEWAP